MTIYRIKYRRLGFLFDLLSFIAFVAILGSTALHIFYQQPLLYIIYCTAAFIGFKTISKSILAVKISIDTSSMHDPTSHPKKRKPVPAAAATMPAQEPVLQIPEPEVEIPVLDEVIAEPDLVEPAGREAIAQEQQRRLEKRKRLHEQKRQQEREQQKQRELQREEQRLQELKRLEEKQELKKQKKLQEQKRQQEQEQLLEKKRQQDQERQKEQERILDQERAKKGYSFNCDYVNELDIEALTEEYLDICSIDNKNLIIGTPDITGELTVFETVKKSNIKKITYEELRHSSKNKFPLFAWLTTGVVSGLVICLVLVILLYKKTGHLPGEDWLITTMIPVMALATFGGLFTGILIPHKKTKVIILYSILRKSGHKIQLVTGYKGFKRARKAFSDYGLVFAEVG